MKISSITSAIFVVLMVETTSAFTVVHHSPIGTSSFVSRPVSLPRTSKLCSSLTMFAETSGGMEELQEYLEQPMTKKYSKLRRSPAFFKTLSASLVPVSAVLGFVSTPSRRLVAHTVGGVLTGIAGVIGKSKFDEFITSSQNAKPALVEILVDKGLQDVEKTQQALRIVKQNFDMDDGDFMETATEIYASYLVGMVKYNNVAKTSELQELQRLKQTLELDGIHVGEAHLQAAQAWYRETCLFTPEEELEDPDHPDRKALDKFLFLSERVFSNESPQAFKYEMTRLAKALLPGTFSSSSSYEIALERVAEVAKPFYMRALSSTRAKLDDVHAGLLEKARRTLGIDDETAQEMHVTVFDAEIRELLGLPNAEADNEEEDDDDDDRSQDEAIVYDNLQFPLHAKERLDKLRDILGLSESDADYEIALVATPLFQSTALAAMKDVLENIKTPEQGWEIIDRRQNDLLLSVENASALLSSMVMQALGGPLERTHTFAKVNNEAATYDNLLEALAAKKALIAILAKSDGWEEEFDDHTFDETFCNPWDKQSANGFLSSDDRIRMYRIFVNRAALKAAAATDGEQVISDETHNQIQQVQGLLGISDQQAEVQLRQIFGKKLTAVLQNAMNEIVEDYTPELAKNMKDEVQKVLNNYRLSQDYLREIGASFYAKAVQKISDKSPSGIPTSTMCEALESFRNLVHLTKEETYPAHLEHFGTVYKKSVLEAMGQTGIIRTEFRESLANLRDRLGVSEDQTKKLYLEAVGEKMRPMAEWIGSEMERTLLSQQQLSRRRKKDMGEDVFQSGKTPSGTLGLGADVNIMSDIMELVDFYTENQIVEKSSDGTAYYPVTALGLGAIDQEMAELLYRQFIVGGFTAQGPNASRYEASRDTFAGILGLSEEKKEEVGKTIGGTVYDNFVSNAMKTKSTMDQQDMMFLANIQGKLGLSADQGEKLLLNSQKKVLSEEIDMLMDKPTPEGIKAFREKCNSLGMDLTEDVGVSKARLVRMFEGEVIPGLKSGEINVDNSDILTEIQESLGVEPEECETMFENVLMKLSQTAFGVIKGEILRGREENTVDLIKELVRYASFTGGDLGLEVEEATGHKICNIYDAVDFDGESSDQIEANKDLLRAAMGLS